MSKRRFSSALALGLTVGLAASLVMSPGVADAAARPTTSARAIAAPRWAVTQNDRPYSKILASTIHDLELFWSAELPKLYGRKLDGNLQFYGVSQDQLPPSCGGSSSRRAILGNAFYCSIRDYIAWDDEVLFPRLDERRGAIGPAIVVAHEVAHAMQARARVRLPSALLELQADCFAGAWAARIESGSSLLLRFDEADLDKTVLSILSFRDDPGVDPRRQGAHGNGFDRVNALQLGFEGGAKRCAEFPQRRPTVTESSFRSFDEQASGGDVSYDESVRLAREALNDYWTSRASGVRFETVETYDRTPIDDVTACQRETNSGVTLYACAAKDGSTSKVLVEQSELRDVYDKVGDFGVATVLSDAWASAAARKLGAKPRGRLTDASLLNACLTGAWTAQQAEGGLNLSPGDLDEAIITVSIAASKARSAEVTAGAGQSKSAFERVRALRTGFFGGLSACTG